MVAEDAGVSGDIFACMTELVKAVRRESSVKAIPQERISERIAEQTVDVSVPNEGRNRSVF